MSEPAIVDDDESQPDCALAATEGMTVSRALSGPLAALGAIRYELGRDQVWVIGRLPTIAPGRSNEQRRKAVRQRSA